MAKTFRISWEGYPGNPEPEVHGFDWFTPGMGFDPEEVAAIDDLMIGEDHTMGGPFDTVTVERLT